MRIGDRLELSLSLSEKVSRNRLILKWKAKGMSLRDISVLVGVSKERVRQIVRRPKRQPKKMPRVYKPGRRTRTLEELTRWALQDRQGG